MAAKKEEKKTRSFTNMPFFKRKERNANEIIDRASYTMYGTTTANKNDVADELKKTFHSAIQNEIKTNNMADNGYSSFISEVISNDNKRNAFDQLNLSNDDMVDAMSSFIQEAYRNRLLEQHDIFELSTQLVDLQSAIEVTKDAIVSSNTTEGRMNRILTFKNNSDEETNLKAVVENIEKKFDLQNSIKNFIVPYTLTYGEYYVYLIPYAELFAQFKNQNEAENRGMYHEAATITEGFDHGKKTKAKIFNRKNQQSSELDSFLESVYNNAVFDDTMMNKNNIDTRNMIHKKVQDGYFLKSKVSESEFKQDMITIMDNITVSTKPYPLPVLSEGISSMEFIQHMMESETKNPFDLMTEEGVYVNGKSSRPKSEFDDIPDCYLSMLEPTKVIPMRMMRTTIGYCVILEEEINPISGVVSNNIFATTFTGNSAQETIIDALADRVVKSFDKPFLKKNIAFKKAIVDCFRYYNLNERKIRFQFIPAEYIVPFKIDRDINDNGTSLLHKSLFWGKLYLMHLLFKIMSDVLYSNDQKVTYLKSSGLDRDITNKVQEVIRINQSRQINVADLFSYTTLLNKVGNGNSMLIPVGRSGDKAIETEILSGQDIQINSELMELLRNNMILGTGVPPGILNYMHEADYAKTIDENHSKFNAKVVNYQIDFNFGITELYKRIMKWSTNLPEETIDSFEFAFQPPRLSAGSAKSELINNFQASRDFLVSIYFPDPNEVEDPEELRETIRIFSKKYLKSEMPMFNHELIESLILDSKIEASEESLRPDKKNGDNGDDDGFDEALKNANI